MQSRGQPKNQNKKLHFHANQDHSQALKNKIMLIDILFKVDITCAKHDGVWSLRYRIVYYVTRQNYSSTKIVHASKIMKNLAR